MWKALIFFQKAELFDRKLSSIYYKSYREFLFKQSYQLYDAVLTLLFIADVVPEKRGT